jgi:hypothetical protein
MRWAGRRILSNRRCPRRYQPDARARACNARSARSPPLALLDVAHFRRVHAALAPFTGVPRSVLGPPFTAGRRRARKLSPPRFTGVPAIRLEPAVAIRLKPSSEKPREPDAKTRHEFAPVTRRKPRASYASRATRKRGSIALGPEPIAQHQTMRFGFVAACDSQLSSEGETMNIPTHTSSQSPYSAHSRPRPEPPSPLRQVDYNLDKPQSRHGLPKPGTDAWCTGRFRQVVFMILW